MINTSAHYLHCQASLEAIHEALHSFQQLSYNMKACNHLQSVTRPPQSLADLHCMSYYQYFIIISFQRPAFNLPSLALFLHTSLYSLYSENFTFQIHLFTFKFVSFIFTPYKISLLHSHHFNIKTHVFYHTKIRNHYSSLHPSV